MITFNSVSKSFKNELYSNLNFTINAGDFVGLSGASGSGKTTILRMIAKLDTPTSGSITNSFKSTGYIFQDFNLFPHLSVMDNLCIAPKSKKESNYKSRALELIKIYELENVIDSYPDQLSGGERQRVAIARCLMNNPDLILVDEATSSLDYKRSKYFMDTLKSLNESGTTIIFITHDLDILNEYATSIIKL